ncbi:MAG: EAL domain-containing protein, partial [Lachnospiraceae bacterium]|nr:EAL domain-containing protein [Lachnospiraceae bacterium]
RQYIIENIDRAIDEGWIQVYYQPIVRAANGRVCDEEALARWIDPEKGFLTPDKFIPVLEDSNLIYKLGLYITDKVLEKMRAQAYAGLFVVPMSVNLSRSDFDSCDIVEEIRKRTEAAGVSPDMLTIEITESIVGNDFDYIKTQVERFQNLGFKVWMDDFGSGYSSLDVLQSIRFDLIKLDMRFMQEFDKGEKSKIILTELIRMAIGLGIDTVVEGVETIEQVEFLREIGATKLQGFYFCKPVPYEEILTRHREGRQIGFENPDEAEYFETLGRVNLYDMSKVINDDEDYSDYFATNPMSIVELDRKKIRLIRGNASYRDFFAKYFSAYPRRRVVELDHIETDKGKNFYEALLQSADDGKSRIIDETLFDASTVHLFIRRIAKNPVTRVVALVIAVLSISDRDGQKGK